MGIFLWKSLTMSISYSEMLIILIVLVFVMPLISVFQGGERCRFSSDRAFPRNVQSGFAVFANLDIVEVKRCNEDSLVGRKIPRMLILTAYTIDGWNSAGEVGDIWSDRVV